MGMGGKRRSERRRSERGGRVERPEGGLEWTRREQAKVQFPPASLAAFEKTAYSQHTRQPSSQSPDLSATHRSGHLRECVRTPGAALEL